MHIFLKFLLGRSFLFRYEHVPHPDRRALYSSFRDTYAVLCFHQIHCTFLKAAACEFIKFNGGYHRTIKWSDVLMLPPTASGLPNLYKTTQCFTTEFTGLETSMVTPAVVIAMVKKEEVVNHPPKAQEND